MGSPAVYAHAARGAARTQRRSKPSLPLWLCGVGMGALCFYRTQVGGYPLSDWFFVAATGAVVMTMLAGRSFQLNPPFARRAPAAVTITSLALVTAGTISTMWSVDRYRSMSIVVRLVWLTIGWLWLFRSITVDRAALARLITALKVSALIASAAAITGYLGLQHWSGESNTGRQTGFHLHPNHLGAFLAIAAMFYLVEINPTDAPRRTPRWTRVAVLGVVIFANTTSGSMTAATATIGGALAILAIRRLSAEGRKFDPLGPIKRMLMIVLAGLAVLWLMSTGSSVVERFTDLFEGEGRTVSSADSRANFTRYVWGHFDEYLVVGMGLDAESPTGEDRDDIDHLSGANHNMPMKILYQAGLPAVVAVIVLVVVTARLGWTLVLNTRGTPLYPVAVASLAALVVVNIVAQTQPVTYEREYWLPFALIAALWALRRRELAAAPAVEDSAAPAGLNGSSNGRHPEGVAELGNPA